jgi:membrane dipeptidase
MLLSPYQEAPLIIDTHADTPQRFVDENWNFTDPLGHGHINLQSAKAGGLSAEFFAIWVEPTEWRNRYAFRTLQLIDGVYQQLRKHPEAMRLGLTAADILAAHKDNVFCVLLGLEGGHSIENDLGLLRIYHRLGVRYMTLTWSNSNEWADSSGDLDDPQVPHHNGLTDFGRDVVREMNRLGMMVDVSHVADTTFWHVLETTRAPILASHSSARALANVPRNLTDDQLRAITKNNGVVMVNFYPGFLDETWRNAWAATSPERERRYAAQGAPYREKGLPVPYSVALEVDRAFYTNEFIHQQRLPSFEVLVDHIEHVARIAGEDHVGIGSDFDGFPLLPDGLESAADLPKIFDSLTKRGFTQPQMQKLLAGNLLRVFAEVEALAEK